MGSVSSANPGLTDLLQTLSGISPVLSSPSVTSALEKASPADIVQLSTAATELESVDALFGAPQAAPNQGLDAMLGLPSTSTATDPATQALDALFGAPASSSSTNQTSTDLQAAEAASLLESNGASGSLLNVLG